METKSVLLVDAFADEPLAGVPIAVVPDEATTTQLRSIAGEFGTSGAVTLADEEVRYVEQEDGAHAVVEAAVAGWTGLLEHDRLGDDTETITAIDSEGNEREFAVESDDERDVRVTLPEQSIESVSLSVERLGPALGVDAVSVDSVGDELPVEQGVDFGGTLFVPVGFLEDLTSASPDRETLANVLAETETSRVCAFTFDTLARRADLHVRVFDPTVPGCERPASGVAIAGCGRYLRSHEAFDGDIDTLRVESGHFLDRPGTVETTLIAKPQVGGRALTVLDTTMSVPEDDEDDIIEL